MAAGGRFWFGLGSCLVIIWFRLGFCLVVEGEARDITGQYLGIMLFSDIKRAATFVSAKISCFGKGEPVTGKPFCIYR